MTTNIGTLFPVTIAAGSDTADVDAAFKYYHWGQTTELAGSSMTTSGGGITGALYRLTNNPKFYGNSTAPYLTVYSGTVTTPVSPPVFTVNGSTNTLIGALAITGALSASSLITATAGVKGSLYSASSAAITIDTSATDALFVGNIKPTSTTNGRVTQSSSSTSAPGSYTPVGKIYVQSTAPSANIATSGDLWFW